MSKDYPHLADTAFPDMDSINVYKYQNNVNYEDYTNSVVIKLLNVPWCGDYDNVVYWETKDERDAWFGEQGGITHNLDSMFRLYTDGTVKVPISIDYAMYYNYVMIDYGKLPYQSEASNNTKMFYFINDVKQLSPSTTELSLSVDYWTTYINDMHISYVNLVRGHYPMAQIDVEKYLGDPIVNNSWLLAPDINFGEFNKISALGQHVYTINAAGEEMMLCFATNAEFERGVDNDSKWEYEDAGLGDSYPTIPTEGFYDQNQAIGAVQVICTNLTNWESFRGLCMSATPQFFTTVKAMFICPKKLLNISDTTDFTFRTIGFYYVNSSSSQLLDSYTLTKEKFGFDTSIADITKLYTYPYCAIEIDDFKGNTSMIKIEDTAGTLNFYTVYSHIYPFLNFEGYLTGIGHDTTQDINIRQLYNTTYTIGGRDYNFNFKWSFPVFNVQLTPGKNWETYYKISADAISDNVDTNVVLMKDVLDISNQATRDITTNNQEFEKAALYSAQYRDYNDRVYGWFLAHKLTDLDIDYGGSVVSNNNTAAVYQTAGNLSLGVASTVAGFGVAAASTYSSQEAASNAAVSAGGNVIQSAISGYGQAINTGYSVALANANYQVAVTKETGVVNAQWGPSTGSTFGGYEQGIYQDNWRYNKQELDYRQKAIIGGSASGYDSSLNPTTYSGTGSNTISIKASENTYDKNKKAMEDIRDNNYYAAKKQCYLINPPEYGQMTGTPEMIDKPYGLRYNIIKQSDYALHAAAEQFLRYGYMINREVNISDFRLMSKFTYWKCDRVYCNDQYVYEGAQRMIKEILNNGVTVWANPAEIGNVSIYDNKVI